MDFSRMPDWAIVLSIFSFPIYIFILYLVATWICMDKNNNKSWWFNFKQSFLRKWKEPK